MQWLVDFVRGFYIIIYMNYRVAMDCYIRRGDEVLLIKRKPDLEKFPDFCMGPGGGVEDNETVITACEREVEEETGLDIENVKLRIVGNHSHLYKNEALRWMPMFLRLPHQL